MKRLVFVLMTFQNIFSMEENREISILIPAPLGTPSPYINTLQKIKEEEQRNMGIWYNVETPQESKNNQINYYTFDQWKPIYDPEQEHDESCCKKFCIYSGCAVCAAGMTFLSLYWGLGS